jgi:site-specific DNA-methyltransferase (adenine-specific)
MTYTLHLGDCIDVMRAMPDNSVDSIVTDPPYHLTAGKKGGTGEASVSLDTPHGRARISAGFMGMTWDGGNIAFTVELWAEALRVLKPGGHLLAFSGSRTYHRMACAIEDAGFEVRDRMLNLCGPETKYGALWDSLNDEQRGALAELLNDQLGLGSEAAWTYGSGFPKSMNVSKAIDKAAGAEREVLSEGKAVKRMIPGADQNETGSWIKDNGREYVPTVTVPATDAARQWDGWGTALKPAHEPICVARKPLIGTVAANVLAHGTGALNIDGCRVAHVTVGDGNLALNPHLRSHINGGNGGNIIAHEPERRVVTPDLAGRWPANLIHDGSAEVVALFPANAGASAPVRGTEPSSVTDAIYGKFAGRVPGQFYDDSGSAARFFYCAKASKSDRNEGCENMPVVGVSQQYGLKTSVDAREGRTEGERTNTERANTHPTVKPTDLMAYLVRLVTPPGGVVLDPFMGSGSTGKAAMREGFRFIGAELSPDYLAIAEARIASEQAKATARAEAAKVAAPQLDLFAAPPHLTEAS